LALTHRAGQVVTVALAQNDAGGKPRHGARLIEQEHLGGLEGGEVIAHEGAELAAAVVLLL